MSLIELDPKHIASRIQIARSWMGKSAPEVAAQLNIAPSTYRGYESGLSINDSVLEQIAAILNVPVKFFQMGPLSLIPSGELSFRKRVRLKSPFVMHVRAVSSFLSDLVIEQERLLDLPKVKVPYARASGIVEIEDIVKNIRNDLSIVDAPLKSALDLVESLGVSVFWVTSDPDFDAVSFWSEDRPYILINETHKDGYRVRFSVLHELGHLVLHRHSNATDTYEDDAVRLERDANAFASAMLMPAIPFTYRFSTHWGLMDIFEERVHWRASCAAIVRRARDLKIISEERYRQLYIGISTKGWRKREPGAPNQEESRVHRFFFDEAGEIGLTTDQIANQAGSPISWIYETMPISRQYLSNYDLDFPQRF
ncbi:MAG: hypothetical protein BGO01_14080 [Armatimonadetes bacterium 55-13]|nr:MAG: hypothetical protein BGO01_14080 [Armatimonadetes bacterium 55-13]